MKLFDKVKKAVQGKSGKINQTVDKAVDKIDEKTDGKYSDKLTKGADKVKDAARRLDEKDSPAQPDDTVVPPTPPPSSATDPGTTPGTTHEAAPHSPEDEPPRL